QVGGDELDRWLDGEHGHQLQRVVLHDVAQRTRLVVELAAPLDAHRLGHGDLHRVDVAPVPDRLEEAVPEAEDGQVLDGLLAEVVVDPIDLALAEDLADLPVQLPGRSDVRPERFLDDDAHPAALSVAPRLARLGEAGRAQLLDDLRIEDGRDRQVEEPIPGGAAVAVDSIQPLGEIGIGGRLVEFTGVELDPAAERLPDRWLDGLVAAELIDALPQLLAKFLVGERPSREAHDRELRREEAAQHEVVQRRPQLPGGQVAGRAADDHGAGLGNALQPQPLAQWIGDQPRAIPPRDLVGHDGGDGRGGWRHRFGPQSAVCPAPAGCAAPSPPAVITAWPPNSLRSAARTRSVYESGSRRLRKRCRSESVMTGEGTLWSIASSTVQRPSPESATQPLICSRSEPSRLKASAASSISHERITLPWFHSSAIAARSSS